MFHPRIFVFVFPFLISTSFAADPSTIKIGTVPNDQRLLPPKDLNGYFPFKPPKTKEEWDVRSEYVKRQVLVSLGLWPMPTKSPLNAVLHGKIDLPEYTLEKVYFESAPGFYVTGNLYRPKNVQGKVPGVLFAHGHWQDARLSSETDANLLREIATGEERFENGGHSRFQSMCVQLARMGCVVWQWDMLSDSDSVQIPREVVHTFAMQRPEMNATKDWGLYSPQAESHLQNILGLQTLNAVRSLDFLLSLPEVDPSRTAITGASGGGTQSMILAAIDPRIQLSFPAVMVSTGMQGGCTCENASLLRVNTGNIEFAALFAPKPQGMTTANDWTKEMFTKGFPELKELYTTLGAPKNVMLHRGEHFRAQLQRRIAFGFLYVAQSTLQTRAERTCDRTGLRAAFARATHCLERATSCTQVQWSRFREKTLRLVNGRRPKAIDGKRWFAGGAQEKYRWRTRCVNRSQTVRNR